MAWEALKIGELARRTGLTVRTLHHYDQIGLLQSSLRTGSEHRLYSAADVARLQQVLSLRQLGFSLEEIRNCLDRDDFSPLEVIRLHVARLREQTALQQELCGRLEALAGYFNSAEEVSAEQFLRSIEVMTMIESFYTPEQLEALKERRETAAAAGKDIVAQGTADWGELFAELTACMNAGIDSADPRVQALEQRRQQLVNAFTGGDAGIEQSLTRLWSEQGEKLSTEFGIDLQLMAYLNEVSAAAKRLG